MGLFQVLALGNHGYPQPESTYHQLVYRSFCDRCGIHGPQITPFRLKRPRRAPHSDFLQLNWVFDAFFVSTEAAAELSQAGFSGISLDPVLDHRTGQPLPNLSQLTATSVLPSIETSQLPVVTCRPSNEESRFTLRAGRTRYTAATPHCGATKHHVPQSPAILPTALAHAPDFFQTAEWFGSGSEAHRLTLCSERFARYVTSRAWRGLQFRSLPLSGLSLPRA